jgi:hypothetical protein
MAARGLVRAGVVAGQSSSHRPLACWQRRAMMLAAPSVVQCIPDCLALDHDRLDSAFDGVRAGEHAELAEAGVVHPVGVALEVAELLVQLVGLDAFAPAASR